MDALTFVAALVATLAWPVTLVVIAFMVRPRTRRCDLPPDYHYGVSRSVCPQGDHPRWQPSA